MKLINFSKMVATGNDFVVIDNRKRLFKKGLPGLARKLCDRKFGVGADGLLLVEKSKGADFRMRIFNPDGSEPEMCGNGSRCIALYARLNKIAPASMRIQTKAGLLRAKAGKRGVKINMTEPKDVRLGISLRLKGRTHKLNYVNTGVPHVICFAKDNEGMDIIPLGRSIRYHKLFAPCGTNVNIVSIKNKSSIRVRTYERGVEAETLACGTGSAASAVISSLVKGLEPPVKVHTRGGVLNIYFTLRGRAISGLFLEGRAEEVFKGKIEVG